jgi:hypothetical protein
MRILSGTRGGVFIVLSLLSTACGGTDHPSAAPDGAGGTPGAGGTAMGGRADFQTPVDPLNYVEMKKRADAAGSLSAEGVAKAYPTAFKSLDYDPLTAQYLDRIQATALGLPDGEKAALGKNGFVISTGHEFATFVQGYATIYSQHLPVYISADALLEAVHSGYDTMLKLMELGTVIPDVTELLQGMRTRLAAAGANTPGRADVDVYLAVALSLIQGSIVAPVAGGDATVIASLVAKATAGNGTEQLKLFGTMRDEDFSQFTVRGHYAESNELQQYFRAMMWLGRVDMRLVETKSDGSQVFNRAQYDAMLLIRDTIADDLGKWRHIDDVIKTFVGKSDNMIVPEVDKLVADLGGAAAARTASDAAIEQALMKGGYGQQRIASYLMVNDGPVKTLPLNRSFLVFGQRYIVDSEVFSAVVYDRIGGRMMPNPLDAAFGALANNQALSLDPDVATNKALPGALARVRVLVDASDSAFWESSFYNLWLTSLRALSPSPDAASMKAGLPKVAVTEAWGRRMLNTQLGSWAELRHDTLLYAKQSYTGIPSCDFPDAYVDPYPDMFAAIRKYAEQGGRIAALAETAEPDFAMQVAHYFDNLRTAASVLEKIATAELAGQELTADQLAFINDAVRIERSSAGCTTIDVPNGWLAKLYFDPAESIVFKPTIADVHTQPADEGGNPVGKVLHVGTGYPRMMVATVDSCGGGPRAYAGVVFAYHEQITTNFDRLTDDRWAANFASGGPRPADVPWLSPVLAH